MKLLSLWSLALPVQPHVSLASSVTQTTNVQVLVSNRCDRRIAVVLHHLHPGGTMASHAQAVDAGRTLGPINHITGTPLYFYAEAADYRWSGSARRISFEGMTLDLAQARLRRAGNQLQMDLDCSASGARGAEGSNLPVMSDAKSRLGRHSIV
jgi:hypothetical protein